VSAAATGAPSRAVLTPALPGTATALSVAALGRLSRELAADGGLWRPLLHVDPVDRWYTRLARTDAWEAWLLTWAPGQRTGLHDHGPSAGAFTVLEGRVEELTPRTRGNGSADGLTSRTFGEGELRPFGANYVHEVAGTGDRPAATLHVYGPHLHRMNRYALVGGRLVRTRTEKAGRDW
jgi:hypothetical protein